MRWTVYFSEKYLPPFPPGSSCIERRMKCFPLIEGRSKELAAELAGAFPEVKIIGTLSLILACIIEVPEDKQEALLAAILGRFDCEILPAVTSVMS